MDFSKRVCNMATSLIGIIHMGTIDRISMENTYADTDATRYPRTNNRRCNGSFFVSKDTASIALATTAFSMGYKYVHLSSCDIWDDHKSRIMVSIYLHHLRMDHVWIVIDSAHHHKSKRQKNGIGVCFQASFFYIHNRQ